MCYFGVFQKFRPNYALMCINFEQTDNQLYDLLTFIRKFLLCMMMSCACFFWPRHSPYSYYFYHAPDIAAVGFIFYEAVLGPDSHLPDNKWMRYVLRCSRNVVSKIICSAIKCFAHIKVTQIINYLFIRFKFVWWELLFCIYT